MNITTDILSSPNYLMYTTDMRHISVHDRMQRRYRYTCTAPVGKRFSPDFNPELTPKQMLALGIFGGRYMRDCRAEFPRDWFTRAKLAPTTANPQLNYFGVQASQPLSVWKKRGWIEPVDPRGWFQWYCRYYLGRRIPGYDEWQIKRWKAIQRHIRQIQIHCRRGDLSCRRRQRQAVLHWAYDSRKI
jgi:hypothetical protein